MTEESSKGGLVSIIMPTFNAVATIDRAIDSIRAQTHENWQLVCVDDASEDETVAKILAHQQQLGVKLIVKRSFQNGGPARARNIGLDACTGDWIALLDADDAWRPDRLASMLVAAANQQADAVCDNLLGFDDHHGQETEPLFDRLPPLLNMSEAVAAEYRGRYNLGYLKPMVSRGFLRRHSIRYDERLRTGEDLLLLLQILVQGGRVACIDAPSYIYTTPFGNLSRKLSRRTSTLPRDQDLAAALERFVEENRSRLPVIDTKAIQQRIAYLAEIATFSQFRHARLSRDWNTALRLLKRVEVRKRLLRSILFDRWAPFRRSQVERS